MIRYGIEFPDEWNPLMVELYCFREKITVEQGGLGTYEHFKNVINILWDREDLNDKRWVWHDWSEQMFEALCEDHRSTCFAAPSSSGKTECLALWSIVNFIASPKNTLIIVLSKTFGSASRNIWGRILERWSQVPGLPGVVKPSYHAIRCPEPFDHLETLGIQCIAAESGTSKDKLGKFLGVKQKRIKVIIDELPDVNESVYNACRHNVDSNEGFRFCGAGNPNSFFDPHGQACEPETGWPSWNPDSTRWKTKNGICLRFDGEQTPNLKANDTLPIITYGYVQRQRAYGDQTAFYKRFVKAQWFQSSVANTIFSPNLFIKFNANQPAVFEDDRTKTLAMLDPSFSNGGDRAIAVFPRLGWMTNKRMGIDFGSQDDIVEFKLATEIDRNHQLAEQFVRECERRAVVPEHIGIDSTGSGALLAEIIDRHLGKPCYRVCFGGTASLLPVSEADPRPANEAYYNRVTEIWWTGRQFLEGDHIRGLTTEMINELLTRQFDYVKDADTRVRVESKEKMKQRIGYSPDLADAAMIAFAFMREKLGILPASETFFSTDSTPQNERKRNETWRQVVKRRDMTSALRYRGGRLAA